MQFASIIDILQIQVFQIKFCTTCHTNKTPVTLKLICKTLLRFKLVDGPMFMDTHAFTHT